MKWSMATRKDSFLASYQGDCITTYSRLVEVFGPPHYTESGDGKITAEWIIKFSNGQVATIYDYKMGSTPMEEYAWHVGGKGRQVVKLVNQLVGVLVAA